jgi:hypothetical protein
MNEMELHGWNQVSKTNSLQGEINIFSNKPYHMDELMFLASTKWIYESETLVKAHYRQGPKSLSHYIIF